MAMLDANFLFLMKLIQGLDIDAIRIVANAVNKLKRNDNATVIITHLSAFIGLDLVA